jgi:transposase InsO family protein
MTRLGHQKSKRTEKLIRARCFWPFMKKDIDKHIDQCNRCILAKLPNQRIRTPMATLTATRPLQIVTTDFTLMDQASNGVENVLVITDVYTKFSVAETTRDQTAKTTARVLKNKFFNVYGVPLSLHSDRGRNFESQVVGELCQLYGVKKSRTCAYSPQGNGQAERFNRTLHNLLRVLETEQKRKWPEYLSDQVFAYNATPHTSTGYSPFYLMFGREPRFPIDFMLGVNEEGNDEDNWICNQRKALKEAYDRAEENLHKEYLHRKGVYDKKAKDYVIDVGTLVYVRNRGVKGRNKIQDAYLPDPWTVIDMDLQTNVYRLEKADGSGFNKVVNRREVTPCPKWVGQKMVEKSQKKLKHRPRKSSGGSSSGYEYNVILGQPEFSSESLETETEESSDTEVAVAPRRSSRPNAGQHSNPHRSPRSVWVRRHVGCRQYYTVEDDSF